MKIKHKEIEIDSQKPFANCKLGREKYANTLTEIVGNYKDGFVLAINNEWGTGKTTFVRMWQKQLDSKGYKTLYFNAWENDFDGNPLVAIMAELKSLTNQHTKKVFKSMVEKGSILAKNIVPMLIKTAAKKYTGSENIADLAKETAAAATEIFNKEIDNYKRKKDGLKAFKESLEKLVKESTVDKPLVFIVDELDRCRPNYAVEVLEQIKHLFSVPGIIFVLSIDKIQLGHAIRGVYGNDRINADEYLRRFIDIEYSLPEASTKDFCYYLFEFFDFASFFNSVKRREFNVFNSDSRSFLSIAEVLFSKSNLTLRQQEKIFAHARLAFVFFKENYYIFPEAYLFLIYLKNFHKDFYRKIREQYFTPTELLVEFLKLVPKEVQKDKIKPFVYLEAVLVFLYNNSLPRDQFKDLIQYDQTMNREILTINSKLDTDGTHGSFFHHLKSLYNHRDVNSVSIDYLLIKIDLAEDLVIN